MVLDEENKQNEEQAVSDSAKEQPHDSQPSQQEKLSEFSNLNREERRRMEKEKQKEQETKQEQQKEKKSFHLEKQHEHKEYHEKGFFGKINHNIRKFYDKKYKFLLIFTMVMLFCAIGVIGYQYFTTGDFMHRDVSLKGGVTVTVYEKTDYTNKDIVSFLRADYPASDFNVRTLSERGKPIGFIIDSGDLQAEQIVSSLQKYLPDLNKDKYVAEIMGSALGQSFFKETLIAVLMAFVFMAVVVFLYFKEPAPSVYIVLAALADIICTLAITIIFNIKISTAGVAAFLMLIGYSVDTDIVLTTRVLKRTSGTVFEAILGAMKTGFTMSFTAMVAVLVAYYFTTSLVIKEIMLILFIGLIFDILNTWLQNASILRMYLEKKKAKQHQHVI